jgi:hypothetical protein
VVAICILAASHCRDVVSIEAAGQGPVAVAAAITQIPDGDHCPYLVSIEGSGHVREASVTGVEVVLAALAAGAGAGLKGAASARWRDGPG